MTGQTSSRKYTSDDLRQIIAANRGDDPRWPLVVAQRQQRTYGAIITLLGKMQDRNLTLDDIERAMNAGVVPELHKGFEPFLSAVHKHVNVVQVSSLTDETGSFAFVDSALAGILERVELKIDRIETKIDDLLGRITKIISREEIAPEWVDLDHVHVSSAEEYARGALHGVPIIAEEQ